MAVIEHCYPGSSNSLPDGIKVTLRIVRLFATGVDPVRCTSFVQAMRGQCWQQEKIAPKQPELVISLGDQQHWGLAIAVDLVAVDHILDAVGAG